MSRTLVSIVFAAVVACGSAAVANAVQGPRTGNPPGAEHPVHAQESPSGRMGQGPMTGQGQDMMGNRQMPAQMGRMMDGCACFERMAQKEHQPSEPR